MARKVNFKIGPEREYNKNEDVNILYICNDTNKAFIPDSNDTKDKDTGWLSCTPSSEAHPFCVDGALTSTELRSAMDAKINKKADSTTLTTELAKKADKTALDAEVARATKKEGELDTAIKANTTAITAEETRANKVEGELDAAVKAEVARATKREGELDAIIKQNTAKISAEEVRAKKVEDELKANKLDKSELNWRVVG